MCVSVCVRVCVRVFYVCSYEATSLPATELPFVAGNARLVPLVADLGYRYASIPQAFYAMFIAMRFCSSLRAAGQVIGLVWTNPPGTTRSCHKLCANAHDSQEEEEAGLYILVQSSVFTEIA